MKNIRIISCNIRKAYADDGDNNWNRRRRICAQVLRKINSDIVCFQEMQRNQLDDLLKDLPGYLWFGMTKTAGCNNPINAIFYLQKRFECLASGGYWLSRTPHIAGSKSWESASIRLANWIRFYDHATRRDFRVVNTHLDHRSSTARLNQAVMLNEDASSYRSEYPQILTGDMNATRSEAAIQALMNGGWQDTHLQVHGRGDLGMTFHRFLGEKYTGRNEQIDWIFNRGNMETKGVRVISDKFENRYPSDHYFVLAEMEMNETRTNRTISP